VIFILGHRYLFAQKRKKKKTKNQPPAYACKTYHLWWFHKHWCIMDSQSAKTRNASLQGEDPPMDFSLLGFVPGLLCASLRASSPAVSGTNQWREDNQHLNAWPHVLAGRAQHLSACLQDASGTFKVLTSSKGLCQQGLSRFFKSPS